MLWFYSALFYFNSQSKLTIKTQWSIKIIAALIQKKTKKKEMEKHVWQLTQSGSTQSQKAGDGHHPWHRWCPLSPLPPPPVAPGSQVRDDTIKPSIRDI